MLSQTAIILKIGKYCCDGEYSHTSIINDGWKVDKLQVIVLAYIFVILIKFFNLFDIQEKIV
jgi:hypothetical protein